MEQALVNQAAAANDDSPATPEELQEYRRIRPVLLEMVRDWEKLRGPEGCPAMRHILRD